MKICILHSSDEGLEPGADDPEDIWPDPALFTSQHTFTNVLIVKDTARAQIDETVAQGYDFYLNFLWGTHDDTIAGVTAIKYFECLGLPNAGCLSWERARSKADFFADAERVGRPPVPARGPGARYPVFVKPAFDFASKLIHAGSLCRDAAEVDATVAWLSEKMQPARMRRAIALGDKDPEQYVADCERAGADSADLVVQEFVNGEEYSVVVLTVGYQPVPLTPLRARHTKKLPGQTEQFLTYEIKYDEGSGYELLDEAANPALYAMLQRVAVEGYWTSQANRSCMGCEVDFRVDRDGNPYVIEVDPMPVWFFPPGSRYEDLDVSRDFPGQHRAALNVFITNYFLRAPDARQEADRAAVMGYYEGLVERYARTSEGRSTTQALARIASVILSRSANTTVLDLACRTGAVGEALEGESRQLIGVDSSERMLDLCRQGGNYQELVHEGIVAFLAHRSEPVNHIFCLSGLQYLSVWQLDFVLVRCFQLAIQSITLMIEEFPAGDGDGPTTAISPLLVGRRNAQEIRSFAICRGWQLTVNETTTTGEVGKLSTFHFVREGDAIIRT